MTDLLNVDDVLARILSDMQPLSQETVDLSRALGRVLAEDVQAAQDVPAFASSAMDGYAVRADDLAGASAERPVRLAVIGDIPAGSQPDFTVGAGQAARIMTGAPMPAGADTVVPVEDTSDRWTTDGAAPLADAVDVLAAPERGRNVRQPGETIGAGERVLSRGTVLRPVDIGVIAALGRASVPVYRRPRVAILSTGTELVPPGEPLAPGQIYNSNSFMLAALVTEAGGEPIVVPTALDTVEDVRRRFDEALSQAPDVLISSAGVSVGTHDVVRTVIDALGHIDLWRVNIRPGKPLAYGQVGGVPFFGLPGNPVSAMVTFEVFVRPSLARLSGAQASDEATVSATLADDVTSDGRRSYVRVRLSHDGEGWWAHPVGMQSSAELMALARADGLLILPEGVRRAPAGSRYPVRLLRTPSAGGG